MCGIVGILGSGDNEALCRRMSELIQHRGPDGSGDYSVKNISLGHRRLSILDLTESGSQPMVSRSGRFVISYNGEIYNHESLRAKLGLPLNGSSDTEVLLESIEKYGLENALHEFCGMFAFSLWDNREQTLTLVRDRFGQKPLYIAKLDQKLVFSSELKSITKVFKSNLSLDSNSLSAFFKYNYIPTPRSIFKEVSKLEPSTFATYSIDGSEIEKKKYWSPEEFSQKEKLNISFDEAKVKTKNVLLEVIEEQMTMDVDYGSFLSGGIDSSLVTSMMQEISSTPVNTFSIGFERKEFNEANYAKEVASQLGTSHNEIILNQKEVLDIVPKMAEIYCEPFSDSSQIPTYLVSKMAKNKVKVCLTGDAGDEVFGGYNRYFWIPRLHSKLSKLPRPLKALGSKGIKSFSPEFLQSLGFGKRNFGDNLHRIADLLKLETLEEYYSYVVGHWSCPSELVLNSDEIPKVDFSSIDFLSSDIEKMILLDQKTYLMDDILVKTDRASMANSLELRVPFLDRRVAELAWQLPLEYKVSGNEGKLILKSILGDYIPKSTFERPKVGFGVPLSDWLRGDLKEWSWDLINPERLRAEGNLNHKMVSDCWNDHQSGKANNEFKLWDVVMFQAWKDQYY